MTALERYKSWLAAPWLDEASKKELADLTHEKEIEDRFYREMEFGTAGMRGVLGCGLEPHERLHRSPRDAGPRR